MGLGGDDEPGEPQALQGFCSLLGRCLGLQVHMMHAQGGMGLQVALLIHACMAAS